MDKDPELIKRYEQAATATGALHGYLRRWQQARGVAPAPERDRAGQVELARILLGV